MDLLYVRRGRHDEEGLGDLLALPLVEDLPGCERARLWIGREMNPVMTARNDRIRSEPTKTRLPALIAHIR